MTKPTKPSVTPWHTGKAVAELLGESNRAKAAAALGMGTTVTSLYRWMRDAEWPMRNIQKAATFFGVSPEWLMTGRGEKYAAVAGGPDPRAAQVEVLYLRLRAEVDQLLAQYTRKLAGVYTDAETPPPPKGSRRAWNPRPTNNPLD